MLSAPTTMEAATGRLTHSQWLGVPQQQDAEDVLAALQQRSPDWIVVDHYALDAEWERAVAGTARCLAIDDLADRHHHVDLLLDQNLGRSQADYQHLVSPHCTVLAGPGYALLRREFAHLREKSLSRRCNAPAIRRILISLGGVDNDNVTESVLRLLPFCSLPSDVEIVVVMGSLAPWIESVRRAGAEVPLPVQVLSNVGNMAEVMADCDLAIGAVGGSAWERCCLGLPTLAIILAENQRPGAVALQQAGAVELLGDVRQLSHRLPAALRCAQAPGVLAGLIERAQAVADGGGVARITNAMGVS